MKAIKKKRSLQNAKPRRIGIVFSLLLSEIAEESKNFGKKCFNQINNAVGRLGRLLIKIAVNNVDFKIIRKAVNGKELIVRLVAVDSDLSAAVKSVILTADKR